VEGVAQAQGALARLAADDEARRRGRGFAEQAVDQLGVRRAAGSAAWWANSSRMDALWVSVASLIDQS
jgi:hypothetical protein